MIKRIWGEIWTFDNLLHTILGSAIAAWVVLFLWLYPQVLPAFMATMFLYLREVGQVQGGYYGHDFRRGWTLYVVGQKDAGWRCFHRHMEHIVPSAIIWVVNLLSL